MGAAAAAVRAVFVVWGMFRILDDLDTPRGDPRNTTSPGLWRFAGMTKNFGQTLSAG